MPKITEFDRHKIVILHQQGHSQREISNKLDKQELVFKKFEELGELKDRKRTGRPRKLQKSEEKFSQFLLRELAEHLAASWRCQVDPCTV